VYEINEFTALLEPASTGWQLQDIFATPAAAPALQMTAGQPPHSPSPPELASDSDDDRLFEVTLKSNALRALRDAELCGSARHADELNSPAKPRRQLPEPPSMEDVTSRVADMHVDPKTGIMSKLMGMLSPSLLGFPTNAARKKKAESKKSAMPAAPSRRSERPTTRSSSLLATHKAQASACKQLGLIQQESDFNDEVLAQYLHLYRQPLSSANVQGLASLAEISSRPGFVLQDKDMAALLKESPYVA
jgi:hypothetical protein